MDKIIQLKLSRCQQAFIMAVLFAFISLLIALLTPTHHGLISMWGCLAMLGCGAASGFWFVRAAIEWID